MAVVDNLEAVKKLIELVGRLHTLDDPASLYNCVCYSEGQTCCIDEIRDSSEFKLVRDTINDST